MEKRIIELYRRKFDDIRHEEDGIEYWYARELMTLLDYIQWRNFENVVKKGMLSSEKDWNKDADGMAGMVGAEFKLGKYIKLAPNFRLWSPKTEGGKTASYVYLNASFAI